MKKDAKKAVALEYDPGMGVPEVIAAARGMLVERLLELAGKHGIPVYRDPDLAEVLSAVRPGTKVPESLYKAVAAVMAYCYRVNEGFRKKIGKTAIKA
jgi:type III secretion system FlhB-like substrate exporter